MRPGNGRGHGKEAPPPRARRRMRGPEESTPELDALGEALRRCEPHRIRLMRGADVVREVAIGGGRYRYGSAVSTAARIGEWDRVELLAKDGAVLEIVERGDEPEVPTRKPAHDPQTDRDERILSLLIRAQAEAREQTVQLTQVAIDGLVRTMAEQAAAIGVLSQVYQESIGAATAHARLIAQRAAPDEGDGMAAKVVPMLLSKALGGAPPPPAARPPAPRPAAAPVNGTPKESPKS